MEIGLGVTEILVLAFFLLLIVGVPLAVILVIYLVMKRKK
jgi:hypothetical protein